MDLEAAYFLEKPRRHMKTHDISYVHMYSSGCLAAWPSTKISEIKDISGDQRQKPIPVGEALSYHHTMSYPVSDPKFQASRKSLYF